MVLFVWSILSLAVSRAEPVHIPLSVVTFLDSGWTDAEVEIQLESLRRAFAPCGLVIDAGAPVRVARPSADLVKFDLASPLSYAGLARATADVPRPAVYLVRGFDVTGAVDAAFSRAAFPDLKAPYPAEVLDTVWLPHVVAGEDLRGPSGYSVLAHELAHVLTLDGQHNGDEVPNLMTVRQRRTNYIPPALCRALARNRLAGAAS